MVLELITSFGYELVKQSWLVATVLVKYTLLFLAITTYYQKGLDLEYFEEVLIQNSRELISLIVLLGFVKVFVSYEIEPVLKLPSQLIALAYFGYLFWKY